MKGSFMLNLRDSRGGCWRWLAYPVVPFAALAVLMWVDGVRRPDTWAVYLFAWFVCVGLFVPAVISCLRSQRRNFLLVDADVVTVVVNGKSRSYHLSEYEVSMTGTWPFACFMRFSEDHCYFAVSDRETGKIVQEVLLFIPSVIRQSRLRAALKFHPPKRDPLLPE